MAGSGTTLVEAQRLGRRAIGCDIDPLARLIASTKLAPLNIAQAREAGLEVLGNAERDYHTRYEDLVSNLQARFDEKTKEFVDYWFPIQQQIELIALLRNIDAVSLGDIRRFLRVVFSSTIIAKSGGVSMARDLAHTRPHKIPDKQPRSAFIEFRKRLGVIFSISDETLEPKNRLQVEIHEGSAATTGLPDESVHLVVTSPPYANGAIDYMRAHKFSLVWLGWKVTELTDIRRRYVGHDAPSPEATLELPSQCESTLRILGQKDSRKADVLRRYFSEMRSVLAEQRRVLAQGRACVVVVGTSILRGVDVETHKGLAAVGESVGFSVAGIGSRRLDRDRRMMPARWSGRNNSQIEQRMHEEYVIGFVRQ